MGELAEGITEDETPSLFYAALSIFFLYVVENITSELLFLIAVSDFEFISLLGICINMTYDLYDSSQLVIYSR